MALVLTLAEAEYSQVCCTESSRLKRVWVMSPWSEPLWTLRG